MTDYEEQVVITGVKSGQHCTICLVLPNERENLMGGPWPLRTHKGTKQQIKCQADAKLEGQKPNEIKAGQWYVHPVDNFAWEHKYVNIHETMMVDNLHQLLKGIMSHLVKWIKQLLSVLYPKTKKRKNHEKSIEEAPGINQLDYRFDLVPLFPNLHHFSDFSGVKQWTGNEEKAIVRQLAPVVAPLLTKDCPGAMQFTRAVLDFVTLAQYRSHDDETIKHMEHALNRIDKLKDIFREFRRSKNGEEGHFNFPKFHVLTHYAGFIRQYGACDGYDSAHMEAAHKYLVKTFYNRTNKRDDFQEQIIWHNTRRINMLAMQDKISHATIKKMSSADDKEDAKVSHPTRDFIDLTRLGWKMDTHTMTNLLHLNLNSHHWRTASQVAEKIDIPNLVDLLAVFIKNCRNRTDNGIQSPDSDLRDPDPSWAQDYPIALHASIICWKQEGKDASDTTLETSELVRCNPSWQRNGGRYDYVWVREHNDDEQIRQQRIPFEGMLIGQVQLVVTVMDMDPERKSSKGRQPRYTGALIDTLKYVDSGKCHRIHGMSEVQKWPPTTAKNPRKVGHRRFYHIDKVKRSAHIVPTKDDGRFYVNNYIDFEIFNFVYDEDFMKKELKIANIIQAEMKQLRRLVAEAEADYDFWALRATYHDF
jgi:hypothetical protein